MGSSATLVQQIIPQEYSSLSDEEADQRIARAREQLGERLVILGHHYQRDEIIKFADYTGDSYKLSKHAAERTDADYVVFCGVHFMAESAGILGAPHQHVVLPNLTAGCSMADMATLTQVEDLWDELDQASSTDGCIPITYMNSSAAIKAFCGEHNGTVCTSSNARKAFEWAQRQGGKIIFFPDEHLGRNTAISMGYSEADIAVWNPLIDPEKNDLEALRRCPIIVWKGWCSVHGRFSVEQIERARKDFPGINVVVHPECKHEVVAAADSFGSTEFIINSINQSPLGSQWAVGTEINLVHRLAKAHPEKLVFCLDPIVCPCSTMYRIHPAYLAWTLENLVDGKIVNEIAVPDRDAHWARIALDRMLNLN